MIFDTHAHYDDESFDSDRAILVSSLPDEGIGRVVNVTASYASLDSSYDIAAKYDHVYSSAGLHPTEIYALSLDDLTAVEALCPKSKVVAVGEIGLDYHYPDTDKHKQKEFFDAQLELAAREGLPVIIHSRDAAADTMDIMKAHHSRSMGGVIHCYSYSYEMAVEYVKMGYYIGIGGVVTYKNARKLKECAARLPLDHIVLETDCPYLAPVPNRGTRNSSLNLKYVAEEIAALRGITKEEVEEATWNNAHTLYRMTL